MSTESPTEKECQTHTIFWRRGLSILQGAFGRGNACLPRIDRHRLTQRTGCRLEDAFGDMVAVGAVVQQEVQIHQPVSGHGLPKDINEL